MFLMHGGSICPLDVAWVLGLFGLGSGALLVYRARLVLLWRRLRASVKK